MKEDAPRVIKIPAKPEATRQAEARRQLRVAAYCRVSTKEEDQANSYEVQKEYLRLNSLDSSTKSAKGCRLPVARQSWATKAVMGFHTRQ